VTGLTWHDTCDMACRGIYLYIYLDIIWSCFGIYLHIYILTYTRMCIFTYVQIYHQEFDRHRYICLRKRKSAWLHTCKYTIKNVIEIVACCLSIYLHICIFTCIHIHISKSAYLHTCKYTIKNVIDIVACCLSIYLHVRMFTNTYTHTWKSVYLHTCKYNIKNLMDIISCCLGTYLVIWTSVYLHICRYTIQNLIDIYQFHVVFTFLCFWYSYLALEFPNLSSHDSLRMCVCVCVHVCVCVCVCVCVYKCITLLVERS